MQKPANYGQRQGGAALAIGALLILALGLGGCGRKGPLEPHPDEPKTGASAAVSSGDTRGIKLGSGQRTTSSPIKAPDRPFILDALL